MAVFALVRRLGAFVILHGLALHRLAIDIPNLHGVTANLGDIALFQIHEAVGDLPQCQLVGGEEVFAQAQTDHQRAAAACGEQAIRLFGADHCQTIGAMQFLDRCLQCSGEVAERIELVM